MKASRWLLLTILPSLSAMLIVSSASGRGQPAVIFDYEVTNAGGIQFADEYERLGGVDTLGIRPPTASLWETDSPTR